MQSGAQESWRQVPGWPSYEVSTLGRVRNKRGRYGYPRLLSGWLNDQGYRMVGLVDADGVKTKLLVHRLVLTAFVGPCPDGMETRHLDGDRTNNALSNLVWGTQAENRADKVRHGTATDKLSPEQVLWARETPVSHRVAATALGVGVDVLRRARRGHTYAQVSGRCWEVGEADQLARAARKPKSARRSTYKPRRDPEQLRAEVLAAATGVDVGTARKYLRGVLCDSELCAHLAAVP